MAIRGVIFDLDGTVADTLRLCYIAYREVFRKYLGQDLSDKEIAAKFGPTEPGIFINEIPKHWQQAWDMFLDLYKKGHDEYSTVFPGIHELMEHLQEQNIRTAMVTGKGPETTEYSLKLLGLEDCFNTVKTGSEDGNIKTKCIEEIIREWGFAPEDVLYVGDAASDVRDARKAGVQPISAAWATTADREELEAQRPVAIFDNVDAFLDWIRENRNTPQPVGSAG